MNMDRRPYYHVRTGAQAPPKFDFNEAKTMVLAVYSEFQAKDYFQRAFGYTCVDDGFVAGDCGNDIPGWFKVHAWLDNVYPFENHISFWEEAKFFAVIEVLFDLISEPVRSSGRFHQFSGCGWHSFSAFNQAPAQKAWREQVNRVLEFYGDGFSLSEDGEIQHVASPAFVDLMTAPIPVVAGDDNTKRMHDAIRVYRSGRSTRKERQEAIVALANVLEFYRPQVQEHLSKKDEDGLFNIANNYSLRHHNHKQLPDYGDEFLDWIFYMYLSTLSLVLKLKARGA